MIFNFCIKFPENILNGLRIMERPQFVMDRQTDTKSHSLCQRVMSQTDSQIPMGKQFVYPEGGDINRHIFFHFLTISVFISKADTSIAKPDTVFIRL